MDRFTVTVKNGIRFGCSLAWNNAAKLVVLKQALFTFYNINVSLFHSDSAVKCEHVLKDSPSLFFSVL